MAQAVQDMLVSAHRRDTRGGKKMTKRNVVRFRQAAVFVVLCVMAASSVAQAYDTSPSWRGQSGSTYQKWTFDSDANPADPSVASNPYGSTSASISVGDFGSGWLDQLSGMGTRTGYWDLGSLGSITIDIPNKPDGGSFKEIWVLVTYYEDISAAPVVGVTADGEIGAPEETIFEVEPIETGGAWKASLIKWQIVPNPDSEQIVFTSDEMFGSIIDEIEIDTICIPEPSSFAALLMGMPFALMLRRRKA